MKKCSSLAKFVIALAILIVAEAVTLYAWSFLLLLEGEPRRHDDPQLQMWAKVCGTAMLLEFLAFAGWLVYFLRQPAPSLPAGSEHV